MLHGLEGSSRSRYARGIMGALHRAGFAVVLMSFRGCGGVPNRLARGYHAGETTDLAYLIERVEARRPGSAIGGLGYSLGGNALLKYLGERGHEARLRTALAVSVPFDLQEACAAVSVGAARLYREILLRRLKASTKRKFTVRPAPFDLARGLAATDFETFDDRITAPLHGFADAADYYRKASCRGFLKRIRVPTLIVHAADDPFMTPAAIPRADELSDHVTLELSERGGHVGFLSGTHPWNLRCWLEERIVQHFAEAFGAPRTGTASGSTKRKRLALRKPRRTARVHTDARGSVAAGGDDPR
jgi:hypothetical protein